MKYVVNILASLLLQVLASSAHAQQLALNAPADKPVHANSEQMEGIELAIQPYINQARASYPDAKKRYLSGLPSGDVFFVTTLLQDSKGKIEQIFVRVTGIREGRIYGKIATYIELLEGFRSGDKYDFAETDIRDWTISKPDGTEEGNYVGKFLDNYRP